MEKLPMKLVETWRKWLNETSDEKYLRELEPLIGSFADLQKSYGGEPPANMPDYAQSNYYNQYSPHSGGRRATYSQAPEEEELEKQLIQLFLKHSDQDFLTSDEMMWAHNLNYRAHAQQGFGSGLDFAKFNRSSYVKAQGQRQRAVLSCVGFQKGVANGFYGAGQYGFFVQPTRVLYASKTDLASQTTRTAHAGVRARYTGKTMPKRPGLDRIKIKNPGELMRDFSKWRRWYKNTVQQLPQEQGMEMHAEFMQIMAALRADGANRNANDPRLMKFTDKLIKAVENFGGKSERPNIIGPDQAKIMRDATLLNAKDISANKGKVEEALLANWTVKGWYFSSDAMRSKPFPEKFWRKILPEIVVPIYTIDQFADGASQLKEISKEKLKEMLR
jgi:hypothetical protein